MVSEAISEHLLVKMSWGSMLLDPLIPTACGHGMATPAQKL